MQSQAPDVVAYLEQVPAERRAALTRLRELCLSLLPGYEEGMEYGMPSYKRNGTIEIGFASQKQYISVYVLKQDVIAANKEALEGVNMGKGCIRFRKPEQIDFDLMARLLADTHASSGPIC